MSKILSLYQNEMYKTFKRVFVIVLLSVMVVTVFGLGTLIKIIDVFSNDYYYSSPDIIGEDLQETLSYHESQLTQYKALYEAAEDPNEKTKLQLMIEDTLFNIDLYKLAIENNTNIYSGNYKSELINIIAANNRIIRSYESSGLQGEEISKIKKENEKLSDILKNSYYPAFIAYKNDKIDEIEEYSDEEKKIYKEENALYLKVNPNGDNLDYGVQNLIDNITYKKLSLLNNIDRYTNQPLSLSDRKNIENDLAVLTYKLENGINYTDSSIITVTSMSSVGLFFLALIIMILAGSSISQELQTGSIKSLIIAPVKRWKIFLAKLLALSTTGLISLLLLWVTVSITSYIYFSDSAVIPYIYAVNGVAHEMHFLVYTLLDSLVNFIDLFVYLAFGMMLSAVTRNTAAAVGISMGVYFAGSTAYSVASILFGNKFWMKFIPFSNLSLSPRIFKNSYDSIMNLVGNTISYPSLSFSLIYLAVLSFCLLFIAHDSFTRRDI